MKNDNQQLFNELSSKNKRLEIYRSNKSSFDNNHNLKKRNYNYEQNNFKIIEEQYQKKISTLESELQKYKRKFEELVPLFINENVKGKSNKK